ncbi:sensor histidine kinase [Cesiribacter andamanensis]|nr:ATP-binding protein [Cesiribacter andamanensis]
MEAANIFNNEEERLQELLKYDILDTPQEEDFENIVRMACQSCQTPMALITLLDDCRQWFKARVGVKFKETPKDAAFCSYAIRQSDVLVVEDTHLDPRFIHNPLVLGEPYIRFYAGVPLQTPAGYNLGTLCVLANHPRSISEEQLFSLKTLARYVVQLLELRYREKSLTGVWQEFSDWRSRVEQQQQVFTMAHIAAGVGIYELDMLSGALQVSNGFCTLVGWQRAKQYTREDFMRLVDPDELPRVEQEIRAALEAKEHFEIEYCCWLESGKRIFIRSSGQIICNEEGDPHRLVGVMQDISERKEYERQLEAQNRELIKVNQELDNFVYRVSHDLRAPMTSVLGLTELLLSYEKDPEQIRSMLLMIRKSLQKQDKFIRDILDYSRNARLEVKPEVVDINELTTEIVSQLQPATEAGSVALQVSQNGQGPFVTDRYRLGVILSNLLSNSFKYQQTSRNKESPWIKVQLELSPDTALLRIADNGMGIPQEHQPRIFDMFYRATDAQPGSGLGLYIVKETVSKLQGSIRISSEQNKGTEVVLELPNLSPP